MCDTEPGWSLGLYRFSFASPNSNVFNKMSQIESISKPSFWNINLFGCQKCLKDENKTMPLHAGHFCIFRWPDLAIQISNIQSILELNCCIVVHIGLTPNVSHIVSIFKNYIINQVLYLRCLQQKSRRQACSSPQGLVNDLGQCQWKKTMLL